MGGEQVETGSGGGFPIPRRASFYSARDPGGLRAGAERAGAPSPPHHNRAGLACYFYCNTPGFTAAKTKRKRTNFKKEKKKETERSYGGGEGDRESDGDRWLSP